MVRRNVFADEPHWFCIGLLGFRSMHPRTTFRHAIWETKPDS